jgi:hypothetical protein
MRRELAAHLVRQRLLERCAQAGGSPPVSASHWSRLREHVGELRASRRRRCPGGRAARATSRRRGGASAMTLRTAST